MYHYFAGEKSAYGIGRYLLKSGTLTLEYDDVPKSSVVVEKLRPSDSLTVHFTITDPVTDDTLFLSTISSLNKRFNPISYAGKDNGGTVRVPFKGTERIRISDEYHRHFDYEFTEPGEYHLHVKLEPTADKVYQKGQKQTFQIYRERKGAKTIKNDQLTFTTKGCRC
jgi:hypothetical protein